MKVLLTGATGFIGQEVIRSFGERAEIFAIVRGDTSEVQQSLGAGVRLIKADLGKELLLSSFPKSIDRVVHCAQSLHYQDFPAQALDVMRINVMATGQLLQYAVKAGASAFCHISSGSVYEPYNGDLNEESILTPTSINGSTKAAAEMLVRSYASLMKTCSLRIFMPYGPGQVNRLLPNLIHRVQCEESITLANGRGPNVSPIHVIDVANIIAMSSIDEWEGFFNVAGIESFDLKQVADLIGICLNKTPKFITVDEVPINLSPSLQNLKSKLDTRKFITFAGGIRDMVATQSS